MSRASITFVLAAFCLLLINQHAASQASKRLDERAKKVATPQQDSWKQVDEINKESDRTRNSYQQSKKNTEQAAVQSHYSIKKTKPATRSPYKKPSPPKRKSSPGK